MMIGEAVWVAVVGAGPPPGPRASRPAYRGCGAGAGGETKVPAAAGLPELARGTPHPPK